LLGEGFALSVCPATRDAKRLARASRSSVGTTTRAGVRYGGWIAGLLIAPSATIGHALISYAVATAETFALQLPTMPFSTERARPYTVSPAAATMTIGEATSV
jgi:hypothetical protein